MRARRVISTGRLPDEARTAELVGQAWERFRTDDSGTPSTVYPILAAADPALFGICVVSVTGRTNPMVNPGALATVGPLGRAQQESWSMLSDGLARFAGRRLDIDEDTYACASRTNRATGRWCTGWTTAGCWPATPPGILDRYTRQSCLSVTARDLAVMGATLADGGVNPVTGEQVVGATACRAARP